MAIELEEFVMNVNSAKQKSLANMFLITMGLIKNGYAQVVTKKGTNADA